MNSKGGLGGKVNGVNPCFINKGCVGLCLLFGPKGKVWAWCLFILGIGSGWFVVDLSPRTNFVFSEFMKG